MITEGLILVTAMYKRFASCRLLDWWEETFLMFELWWILHLVFVFDILMVFWGMAMIKRLGSKICWMNESRRKRVVTKKSEVKASCGGEIRPNFFSSGLDMDGQKDWQWKKRLCICGTNKQREGENVNKRRYWWQERPSFTSSILTTSPTIGNGSTQVRERTQKFFE